MAKLKNPKAKGARRERQTIKLLESQGYRCTKAAGSLGTWDIIALGTSPFQTPIVAQVKSSNLPRPAERLRMSEDPTVGCEKRVYVWIDRQMEPKVYWVRAAGVLAEIPAEGPAVGPVQEEGPRQPDVERVRHVRGE